MKKFRYHIPLLLLLIFTQTAIIYATPYPVAINKKAPDLKKQLKNIPGVISVNELEPRSHFTRHYEIWFEQLTDPQNPESEKFKQRVLLGHSQDNAPVVVELQGYGIHTSSSGEMASLLKANQLTIEHRYFENSRPKSAIPWETLTVENAAHDQHIIIQAIKKALYPNNKFLSTGISKGGQTTMIHRSIYPDDVDASVCYVAPLNFEREDPRIYDFLKSVSTPEDRRQVEAFQIMCFERKDSLLTQLKKMAVKNDYNWEMGIDKAFEFYVLEYSFAFWQWGQFEVSEIPGAAASDRTVLMHLLGVSGTSFFEESGVEELQPYFWAALTQMGIYGYEFEPFKAYLTDQKVYTFDFAFPEDIQGDFDPAPMRQLNNFIQNRAETILFIYGELDTWSATGVELSEAAKQRGLKKYVLKGGHHGTRIQHFDENTQKEIISIIEGWLAQ